MDTKKSKFDVDMTNRVARICLFIIIVYIALRYLNDTSLNTNNIMKLTGIITIGFILLDTYFPKISFE